MNAAAVFLLNAAVAVIIICASFIIIRAYLELRKIYKSVKKNKKKHIRIAHLELRKIEEKIHKPVKKNKKNYCNKFKEYFRYIGNAFKTLLSDTCTCIEAGSYCDDCEHGVHK